MISFVSTSSDAYTLGTTATAVNVPPMAIAKGDKVNLIFIFLFRKLLKLPTPANVNQYHLYLQ